MAGKELIIEESNCREIGNYLYNQGMEIENIINKYITILQAILSSGIVSGDVSIALQTYITYVNAMKGQIENISKAIKNQTEDFLRDMESVDNITF